jgi:hypothetical protein
MSLIVASFAGTSGAAASAPGQAIQICDPFMLRRLPKFLILIKVFCTHQNPHLDFSSHHLLF